MIVSFDLTGILCLIIIPPICIYLCKVAWGVARTTQRVIHNKYLTQVFEKENEVLQENIRLQNEIVELMEKKT